MGEPVPGALTELLYALYASDARGQVRAEKTGIGGLMRQPAHGCEVLVDRVSRQRTRLQVDAVANQDDAIEGQPGFGTVPFDKLVDACS